MLIFLEQSLYVCVNVCWIDFNISIVQQGRCTQKPSDYFHRRLEYNFRE